jgi:uncharacterized protein (TIGR03790 family)
MLGLWAVALRGVALTFVALAQTIPLRDRVLILVNDRVPESLAVGQYYASKRNIPAGNILRLKTSPAEIISPEEFKEQIETPLKKFLDANGGAMRRKIVYIVPTYGVPLKAGPLAVDSVISVMYVGHEELKPPLRNPYSAPVGSRPPHFAEWSDGVAAAENFKMFVVTRLDGPSADIARGLVDKALAGENGLSPKSGVAYFDHQGTRQPNEWQYAVDNEIKSAAELSRKQGFQTVLHVQRDAPCGAMLTAATQYSYDPARKLVLVETPGSTIGLEFAFPALAEAEFKFGVGFSNVQNTGNTITLQLGGSNEKSYVRLVYPFVPFQGWDTHSEIVLEKVVDGAAVARTAVPVANNDKVMNNFGSLRLSVRKSRISAWRDQTELAAVEDTSGKPLPLVKGSLTSLCWCFGLKGLAVTDTAGGKAWEDNFDTNTSARYQWRLSPRAGPNALWVWGWYGQANDVYRFVPGAVGSQLTSFTALTIRTPANPDPQVRELANVRWAGNWVPRMLEEGVTATWGATNEPYATFYAPGGNVFDHLWAGYNFGDSFYIAQNALRWVMVAVGDPLYSPKISR